jgi:hypothetical protein
MAQVIADRRDIEMVIYEQLRCEELTRTERYSGFNRRAFDMAITEARNFALKELLPLNEEADRLGVRFENGRVSVPPSFHRPFRLLIENEMTALTEDPQWGGQGLPMNISQAVAEYLYGANYAIANYALMGHGTGKMIEIFGTDIQKAMFLKNLYTGRWGGTMLLTEPQAGSDVGALATTARRNPDGTYSISGNKIFITNGEHDLTENIIHPVLARIEGDPAGTKGISIFLVPKIWVNPDGSLGEANDIVCTGVEEKMGIHGSSTCSMALGSRGACRGLILGGERQGMKIMFHMMNEARIGVGFWGLVCASAAYLYALNYARERVQGRDLEKAKDAEAPSVPIIRHPDVRRMLLQMKAWVEGMRSLVYYVGDCLNRAECAADPAQGDFYRGMVDLLTPVVKAYCAERGFEVCVQAIQVYGGYGYIRGCPVEQLARDCKIASLYEGTDGIQAMDLLGRKLGMEKGRLFLNLLGEIGKAVERARQVNAIAHLAGDLDAAANRLGETASAIAKAAASERFKTAFAFAHPFLEVVGDVVMGWMLLWRAAIAADSLAAAAKHRERSFYEGQIKSAEYFIQAILPITAGRMNAILKASTAVVEIAEDSFGGL